MFTLYDDRHYVAVIIHPNIEHRTSASEPQPHHDPHSEIHLYNINKDAGIVVKSHVLRTCFNGSYGLAMHSIDDVLVVHNRKAGETWFFDVGLSGEFDGSVSHHIPVTKPTNIITTSPSTAAVATNEPSKEYPTHWVVFSPDIVIDANAGTMWRLKLKLDVVTAAAEDSSLDLPRLMSFMLQREGAKRVLLDTLMDCCQHHSIDLTCIGNSFDRINREYRFYIDQQLAPCMAQPASGNAAGSSPLLSEQKPSKVILDQSDIYTNILSPLLEIAAADTDEADEAGGLVMPYKRVIAILIEYLRSLEERNIPAQHFLHELLINLLVRSGQFYELHQLLQYHIIADSKPLACLLLSLEAAYPAALQLSMDMLKRIKSSDEEITEILLSKGKVISALLYAKSRSFERQIPARKFLQAAKATGDDAVLTQSKNWLKEQRLLTAKDAHDYQ